MVLGAVRRRKKVFGLFKTVLNFTGCTRPFWALLGYMWLYLAIPVCIGLN